MARAGPDHPAGSAIADAVRSRYARLAGESSALACGAALDLSEPRPGEVLVDLGCGRGQDVLRAAERVGPTGAAIGVDSSEAMLARARESVPAGARNVRLLRSDLAALDLPDGSADVVISNCSINHAPDKGAVYREIRRVLRPGGRFVVSDVVSLEELPPSVRADPAAWAACYGGAIPEPEYLAAIRGAGFEKVEVLQRTEPYRKGSVQVRSLTLKGTR
jgi:SAM-dependent methyltransferase